MFKGQLTIVFCWCQDFCFQQRYLCCWIYYKGTERIIWRSQDSLRFFYSIDGIQIFYLKSFYIFLNKGTPLYFINSTLSEMAFFLFWSFCFNSYIFFDIFCCISFLWLCSCFLMTSIVLLLIYYFSFKISYRFFFISCLNC